MKVAMIKGHKEGLPLKICVECCKPISWRKKWEKNWNDVKYCSKRCRSKKKQKS